MLTILAEGTRRARKRHQCFQCYRPIEPGTEYNFFTGKYDYIYTLAMHKDCDDAAAFYCKKAGISTWDYGEGYPPLFDMMQDGGEVELDIALIRGHFPHVACRLEFLDQIRADR